MRRQNLCDFFRTEAPKSKLTMLVLNDYNARDPSKLSSDGANVGKRNMNFLKPVMEGDIHTIRNE
jgi:acyl dehydratase